MATKKKEELDQEMNLMQDKNSLEFGLIASDLDAELKKMAERERDREEEKRSTEGRVETDGGGVGERDESSVEERRKG